MAIEHRDLTPGTQLSTRYHKETFTCTVEQGEGDKLAFVLADGRRFTSLSAAASTVMGGVSANGWRAWSLVAGGNEPVVLAAKKSRTAPAKVSRSSQLIRPVKNQQDTPEGQVKFFCGACLDAFLVAKGETPTACPKGHSAEEIPAE